MFQCFNCDRMCYGEGNEHPRRLGLVCAACLADLRNTDACEAEAEQERQEDESAAEDAADRMKKLTAKLTDQTRAVMERRTVGEILDDASRLTCDSSQAQGTTGEYCNDRDQT